MTFSGQGAAAAAIALATMLGVCAPAAAKDPPGQLLSVVTDTLPKTPRANVRVMRGTFAAGYASEWHMHPSPPFIYVVSGTATWEYKDGRPAVTRGAGQAVMEPVNTVLRLRNRGTKPMVLVLFQASKPGEPIMRPTRGTAAPSGRTVP